MEKFIELFRDVLDREDSILPSDVFRDYNEWNSIAYLSTVVMLKDEYNVQMPLEEFKKLKTVQDIYNITLN